MLRKSPDVMHGVVCWATPASKRPRRASWTSCVEKDSWAATMSRGTVGTPHLQTVNSGFLIPAPCFADDWFSTQEVQCTFRTRVRMHAQKTQHV